MSYEHRDLDDEYVAELLRTAASRLTMHSDPTQQAERALKSGTDRFFVADSPIGELYVAMSPRGVRFVWRADSPAEFARSYRTRFGRLLIEGAHAEAQELGKRMTALLAGERVGIPLDLSGMTPFQRCVLEVVGRIPQGEVRPYIWVAREVGNPAASRAVGNVVANNPVPLLIPCHRIVRNDGQTGNYAFGAGKKVKLLKLEGVSPEELAEAPYIGTPTTGIVCHATCRNARKIRPENRYTFHSASEAVAKGYRSCRVCRPVTRFEAAGSRLGEAGA